MRDFPLICDKIPFNICSDRLSLGYSGCTCAGRQTTQNTITRNGLVECETRYYCPGVCDHTLEEEGSPKLPATDIVRMAPYSFYYHDNQDGSITVHYQTVDSRDLCSTASDYIIESGRYAKRRFNRDIDDDIIGRLVMNESISSFTYQNELLIQAKISQSEWDSLTFDLISITGVGGNWDTHIKATLGSQSNISMTMISVIYANGIISTQIKAPRSEGFLSSHGLPGTAFQPKSTKSIFAARSDYVTEQISIPLVADWCITSEPVSFSQPYSSRCASKASGLGLSQMVWINVLLLWWIIAVFI